MNSKDIKILDRISNYCAEISGTVSRFGNSKEVFFKDADYKKSICMSILQIGELSKNISKECRDESREAIDWTNIIGIRNIFAHSYGTVDFDIVWEIIQTDMPPLSRFCTENVQNFNQN